MVCQETIYTKKNKKMSCLMTMLNVCLPTQNEGSFCSGYMQVSENPINIIKYANTNAYLQITSLHASALYDFFFSLYDFFLLSWALIIFKWPVVFAPVNLFFQPAGIKYYFKKVQMVYVWWINSKPVLFCLLYLCLLYYQYFVWKL